MQCNGKTDKTFGLKYDEMKWMKFPCVFYLCLQAEQGKSPHEDWSVANAGHSEFWNLFTAPRCQKLSNKYL